MSPQAPCSIIATKLIHPSYTLQTQSQEIHRNTKEVCGKQSHAHHCLNKSHLASRMMVRQDFSLSIGIDVKINLRGRNRAVPQNMLDIGNVDVLFKQ